MDRVLIRKTGNKQGKNYLHVNVYALMSIYAYGHLQFY